MIYAIEKRIPILYRLKVIKRETRSQSTWAPSVHFTPASECISLRHPCNCTTPLFPRSKAKSILWTPWTSLLCGLPSCLPPLCVSFPRAQPQENRYMTADAAPVPWSVSSALFFSPGVFLSLFCPQVISRKGLPVH